MKKLTTTHMFFIGAGLALLAGAAIAAFRDKPAAPEAPSAMRPGALAADERGFFESLFPRESKITGRAQKPPAALVPPAPNKATPATPQVVDFTTPKDLAPVVARYPFLAEMATGIQEARNRPDIFSVAPVLRYAEFTDPLSGGRALLVMAEGSGFCGSAGCYAAIHLDPGSGFETAGYRFLAGGDVYYRLDQKNGLALFTCEGNGGVEEFRLHQGKIHMMQTASVRADALPGCTGQ
jgi:hypothetical protein